MSARTRPAVLLSDLLYRDGPHQALADSFLMAECIGCGGAVGHQGRVDGDRWWCPSCWARHTALERGDLKPARR